MAKTIPSNDSDTLVSARQVLATEISGLQQLSDSLGQSFVDAIAKIEEIKAGKGRLILSGIGKSGHVAHKIAATMASTGTPAFFVHPNEASHGDLGMITENDAVLLLSNSGENAELSDMIAYTRRFRIPLIAITSNPDSTLARHSDIPLLIPKAKEACGIGMAPTTSTTIMLALGDALAVVLLEKMGLTREDFSIFHPGGKLGQRLKKAEDLMLQPGELPLVHQDTLMSDVIVAMAEKNVGSAIVVAEDGTLEGIITDGDLKRFMGPDILGKKASEIMGREPKTITPDTLAAEAVDIMLNRFKSPITSLIITEDGRLIGLLRIQECLKAGIV
ncbi:MAG: SIS domain-containing protein [Pseudobdellovibrionaceae bacterium]